MAARLESIEAFPVRVPRDLQGATGTAGTPTNLADSPFDYRWSETYPALYPVHFESALVKVTSDAGLTGWGEIQAPLAPEVACTIVNQLLRAAITGAEFAPEARGIEFLWERMYSTMRVRGQTGGFMLDAISGVDLALWDLAGKTTGASVASLLGAVPFPTTLPAYISGLSGSTNAERVKQAKQFYDEGFRVFKLFYDRGPDHLFSLIDDLRFALGSRAQIAIDALWRLTPEDAVPFGLELDKRDVLWLECPLPPEDRAGHQSLSRAIKTPIALGESYRTRYELEPFFQDMSFSWLQPDLGRCGLTEGLRLARCAADGGMRVVPHVSIAMGPQIAAALHFAAAVPECSLVEYNPKVLGVANCFLAEPIVVRDAQYWTPTGPGLGVELIEDEVAKVQN